MERTLQADPFSEFLHTFPSVLDRCRPTPAVACARFSVSGISFLKHVFTRSSLQSGSRWIGLRQLDVSSFVLWSSFDSAREKPLVLSPNPHAAQAPDPGPRGSGGTLAQGRGGISRQSGF